MRTSRMLAAAVAGAGTALCAAAGIASADQTQSAQDVIADLQSKGYNVQIDKIGTAPIDECVVTSVRNPRQFSQLVPYRGPGANGNSILVPQVISQPISVSLDCTR